MGDPETQVVIPRIKSDFVQVMEAMKNKRLSSFPFEIDSKAATTVVIAANGYPGDYEKGEIITFPEAEDNVTIFHAGTKNDSEGNVLSNGGRVLTVTALSEEWTEAVDKSISTAEKINYKGKYFRRDIGKDLL
jgi:phosphoribosylamine---glycine ligase